tara:strand:+ start:445 stop:627 length:183 start_codon:yes stop_codon:yes gene_type:complete
MGGGVIFFVKRGMFCLVVCLFVEFLEINVLVGSSEVGEWDEQQTIDSSYLFRRLLCGDWK